MLRKLRNLIKVGRKESRQSATVDVVSTLGKRQPVLTLRPYGLHTNAPDGSLVLLLSPEAHEDNMIAFESDSERQDELEEGEVSFGVPSLNGRLKARKDGSFVFIIDGVEGGDFLAKFNELKAGFDQLKSDFNSLVTTYNLHTHLDPVSGSTSGPSSAGSQSTATIDSAKIDKIEVP